MNDAPTPLLIVGSGAMACLFAARLSAAGLPVTVLGTWAKGLAALRQSGVCVEEAGGGEHCYPIRVEESPGRCVGARYALVLVKSWQTERAAQQLARCLAGDGVALTLQNGLGNLETLVKVLGSARAAQGATTTGAYLLGPGKVRPAGEGVVSLGIHAQLKPLADALRKAGFVIETVPDINSLQWGKLVINAAINPLTALLRVANGDLLNLPSIRALMAAAAREAAAVAVGKGVHLPYPDPVVATEAIARRTGNNISSMLQDVLRGAPTEIDAINGAIVLAGEQVGLPTPINRTFWQLVRGLVEKDIEKRPSVSK